MDSDLLLFVMIGFAAQIIDGAIGMAYGLISTTVLLSIGIPPATASASVHAAEVFTTGASAFSHWRFGNVQTRLFWRLGTELGGRIETEYAPSGVVCTISGSQPLSAPAEADADRDLLLSPISDRDRTDAAKRSPVDPPALIAPVPS